jgi:small subunit ribosomal protein S16
MLMIRFNRVGKKNRPHFRVVLQERTKAPGKRHIEMLGSYDPQKKTVVLKAERITYWMTQGVQLSDAVHNLLIREGVIKGEKIAKKMPKAVVKEAPKVEEVVVTETKSEPVEAPIAAAAKEVAPKA